MAQRFVVWGRGISDSALVRAGEITAEAIAVASDRQRVAEQAGRREHEAWGRDVSWIDGGADPRHLASDEWAIEVDADEDELDAQTRHDSAVFGFCSFPTSGDVDDWTTVADWTFVDDATGEETAHVRVGEAKGLWFVRAETNLDDQRDFANVFTERTHAETLARLVAETRGSPGAFDRTVHREWQGLSLDEVVERIKLSPLGRRA